MAKKNRSFSRREHAFMWLNSDIDVELFILNDFLESTSGLLVKETKRLKTEMKEQKKKHKHDRESIYQIDDYYSEGLAKYGEAYKAIFFNTTFVAAVSLFEYLLKKVCQHYYVEHTLTVEDIKANGNIATYRKYIEKVVKIDLSSLDDKWRIIEKYNTVRNAIVHDDANINPKNKPNLMGLDSYTFLSNSPHIKFEPNGKGKFNITDAKFIAEFIQLAERYFDGLTQKLEDQLVKSLKAQEKNKKKVVKKKAQTKGA
ncbi:MAG: hypothetical protein JNJ75_03605 [Cyclobacteriaceae bacterium]|nr:hypothetical protein [Cyclobacteriaceae bacterium]